MQGYELKSTIHSNQFMVIAMDKDSKEFVVKPTVYGTYAEALHSAQQCAGNFRYAKYLVVAVAAVAEAVENPVVVTKYKL